MGRNFELEKMTFDNIRIFLQGKGHDDTFEILNSIITASCIIFPYSATKIFGIPADKVNDLATGLTLAGVGCTSIVSNIITNIKSKLKSTDYEEEYLRVKIAHYMLIWISLFDAMKEIKIGDDDSWLEEYKRAAFKDISKVETENDEFTDVQEMFVQTDIQKLWEKLIEEAKIHFFKLDFWKELGDDKNEQELYYDEIFEKLIKRAWEKYKSQRIGLSKDFPYFDKYLQYEHADKFVSLAMQETQHVEADDIDLYKINRENYYLLFSYDKSCSVQDMFLCENYFWEKVNPEKADSEKVDKPIKDLSNITEKIGQQRFILITGSYGSGKTILLKNLHSMYMQKRFNVYTFNAVDLFEILQKGKQYFYLFCKDTVKDEKRTIIFIDSIDDLNLPKELDPRSTWLDTLWEYIFSAREKLKKLHFVVSGRLYSTTENEDSSIAERMYMYSTSDMEEGYIVKTKPFSSETIGKWIKQFAQKKGLKDVDKSVIKKEHKKIISALETPLFLYIFMKKYKEEKNVQSKEGYYFYYESFLEKTIRGKYWDEKKEGANVIKNQTKQYKRLLQQLAFEILKKYNEDIKKTIVDANIIDSEPLLADELQSRKYVLSQKEFSGIVQKMYDEIDSTGNINKANYINCYFIKMLENSIFFTDTNILFVLAAEKIYNQLLECILNSEQFNIKDLDKVDVIDFYPQILDYIIYKIKKDRVHKEEISIYFQSFVVNTNIKNRLIPFNDNQQSSETLSQIIMLYIIFFKLNQEGFASREYIHIFKELMQYVNMYKTLKYSQGIDTTIYTVERYFMNIHLNNAVIKRINLKAFNFQESKISDVVFEQCKLDETNFESVLAKGMIEFRLCRIKNCNFMLNNSPELKIEYEMRIGDCNIINTKLQVKKLRFMRCFIKDICLYLKGSDEVMFDNCVIETLHIENIKSKVEKNATEFLNFAAGEKSSVIESENFAIESEKSDDKQKKIPVRFKNCIFKTDIDLIHYNYRVEIIGKSLYLGEGRVFKNFKDEKKPQGIDNIMS